jgi:hypothetical protein
MTQQPKACEWPPCGKPFEPKRQANRRSRYCSPACRLKAHRAHRVRETNISRSTAQDVRFKPSQAAPAVTVGPVSDQTPSQIVASTRQLEPQEAVTLTTPATVRRTAAQLPQGAIISDWKPCLPSDWESLPDLPIPDFLDAACSRAKKG